MSIEWPAGFWGPPGTDADSEDLRVARNRASESVLANRAGRPIVAVSGSGTSHDYRSEAKYLGEELARRRFTLTTGGLDGVMFYVTDGFVHAAASHIGPLAAVNRATGKAIGIVPREKMSKAKKFASDLPGAILIETDLTGIDSHGANHKGPGSRNHVLIATADAVVCMPGSHGGNRLRSCPVLLMHDKGHYYPYTWCLRTPGSANTPGNPLDCCHQAPAIP